jgi:hypothetical protein
LAFRFDRQSSDIGQAHDEKATDLDVTANHLREPYEKTDVYSTDVRRTKRRDHQGDLRQMSVSKERGLPSGSAVRIDLHDEYNILESVLDDAFSRQQYTRQG